MVEETVRVEDVLPKPVGVGETGAGGIQTVAVVGLGTMGQGIAHIIAQQGIQVLLYDKDSDSLDKALHELEEMLDREIERWGITKSDKRAILSRMQPTQDKHRLKDADIVIEAVPDVLSLKQDLFVEFDEICRPETIFVSNTSTLSLTEIAEATGRQDKVIGMHFLNPVPKTQLVEIVRALKTSDATFQYINIHAGRFL